MIDLLYGSLGTLLVSMILALVYEIAALMSKDNSLPTISSLVQTWGQRYKFPLVTIESVILAGLVSLFLHFLGLF